MQYNVNACDLTLERIMPFPNNLVNSSLRTVVRLWAGLLYTEMVRLFEFTIPQIILIPYPVTSPTAPNTEINEKGNIITTEVVCEGVRKLEGQ